MQYLAMFRRYTDDECVPAYMRNDALAHQEQMEAEVNEADPALNFTVLGHMSTDGDGPFAYMVRLESDLDNEALTEYLQTLYDEYGIAGRYIIMGRGENIVAVNPVKSVFKPPYAWGVADNAEKPHAWVSKDEEKVYILPVAMGAEAEGTADQLNRDAYELHRRVHYT